MLPAPAFSFLSRRSKTMRRFFFVLLLLMLGMGPVKCIENLSGTPAIGMLYLELMVSVMALTFVYGILKAIFFPPPIAVVMMESPPRRRWFKWPSNQASSQ
jgi:hypothetical protein